MLSPLEPIISSRSQLTGHIWRFQAWINHKVMMVSTKLTSEHLERWVLNEKGFSCDSKCSLQQKSGTISPEYVTWSLARAAVRNFRLVHTPHRCSEDWHGQLTKLTVYCLIRKAQHYSLADTEAPASLWLRCLCPFTSAPFAYQANIIIPDQWTSTGKCCKMYKTSG